MTNLTMLDVIKLGASRRRPMPAQCPSCGEDAPLASKDALGGFYIACQTDRCKQYAEADTLAEVWELWDEAAALEAIGCGGIK